MLRERGAEFGIAERPNLQRVLADPKPEQVIDGIVTQSESAQRAQAAAYQERVRQAAEVARRAQEQRPRGPRMGM